MAGYSGTPLAKKLGIKPGSALFAIAAPGHYEELLAPLPEGVKRVRKIEAQSDGAEENARRLAARIGEKAFWEHEQRLASLGARWEERLSQSGQAAPTPPAPQATTAAKKPSKGGKLMGIGGISIAAGLIFYGIYAAGAEWAGVPAVALGITIGPILLLIGFVMYLSS